MASMENVVLEIEAEYKRITSSFDKYLNSLNPMPSSSKKHVEELGKLVREVTNFQRIIEYDLEFAEKLAKRTKYYPRLSRIAQTTLEKLSNKKITKKIPAFIIPNHTYLQETKEVKIKGVIPTLRSALDDLIHFEWYKSEIGCVVAAFVFKTLGAKLPELEADMRLVGWLTDIPLDKKIAMKNRLSLNGFQQVVVSLEQAESNLEEGHNREGLY